MAYHHGNLREALLERAAEVIASEGLEGLSLRGLARDLGVSHGAPRRHFEDRSALLAALAREGYRRSVDAMHAGADAAGDDPVARYRALGRAYVEFARRDPAFFAAISHPEVRALADDALRAAESTWFAALREAAVAAQQAGWHPEADLEALVAFSVAAAQGTAELFTPGGRFHGMSPQRDSALADAVLDLVVGRTGPPVSDIDLPGSPSPDPNERRVS